MPVKDIKLLDVDIKRMTKDPNPGIFIFPFFVRCVCVGGGGAGQCREGQGKGRCLQGSGSNYFHMWRTVST